MPEISVDTLFEEYRDDLEFQALCLLGENIDRLAFDIKCWREQRGMSQKDLAEKLGTQQSRVSQLENPEYARHNLLTLAKVAVILDIDLVLAFKPKRSCSVLTTRQVFPPTAQTAGLVSQGSANKVEQTYLIAAGQ